MALDDAFDVFSAAVAYFNGIGVEDFVELVVFGEVLVNKLQKSSGNFGLDVLVKWWVEPCDMAFAILSSFTTLCIFGFPINIVVQVARVLGSLRAFSSSPRFCFI